MSADVYRQIARQSEEDYDDPAFEAWQEERDRQLDVDAWYRATEYVERMEENRG